MTETFTSELVGQTVIIENAPRDAGPLPGWKTTVRLKESGLLIENITHLVIDMWPGKLVTAELTLVHRTKGWPGYAEEAIIVENPEIHLIAEIEKEERYQVLPEADSRHLKIRKT
jgi:hypothetical protein